MVEVVCWEHRVPEVFFIDPLFLCTWSGSSLKKKSVKMEVHPFKSIQSPFYDQFGQQWHLCHLGAAIAFTQVNLNRCSFNML